MNRVSVSSSHLRSVGYDLTTHTLEIEFVGGEIYRYTGVPALVHADLMAAVSHGTYFNAIIKQGGYPYVRIR